jgi:membrane associated rhomboid family serine protease
MSFSIFPVGTTGPDKYNARVTQVLIAINVLVFVWEMLYIWLFGQVAFEDLLAQIAFNVCDIGSRGIPELMLDNLRSMFLHGGVLHVLGNMMFLYIFGRKIEEYFGAIPFLLFYLLAGFAATAGHVLFAGVVCTPADPYGLIVGASGAVAGVLGAFMLLYPFLPVKTVLTIIPPFGWQFKMPAMFYLLYWFVLDFVQGLGWIGEPGSQIAHWAHIIGFIFGFALVFLTTMFWKPAPKPDPFAYLDD